MWHDVQKRAEFFQGQTVRTEHRDMSVNKLSEPRLKAYVKWKAIWNLAVFPRPISSDGKHLIRLLHSDNESRGSH